MKKLGSIHPIKLVLITALVVANLTTYFVFFENNNQSPQILGLASDTAIQRATGAKASKVPKATKPPKPTPTPTPTPTPPPSGPTQVVYLSDLNPTSVRNGLNMGPIGIDKSNGESGANDGYPITLTPRMSVQPADTFPKGLGVHAVSEVVYTLNGKCSRFEAYVGIDDEVGNQGNVNMIVYKRASSANTVRSNLWESTPITGASATQRVSVPLAGAYQLILKVNDMNNDIGKDHADWADAKVTCVGLVPPVSPSPSPSPSSSPSATSDNTNINETHKEMFFANLDYNSSSKIINQLDIGKVPGDSVKLKNNKPVESALELIFYVKVFSGNSVVRAGWYTVPKNAVKIAENEYVLTITTPNIPVGTINLYLPDNRLVWTGTME